MVAIPFRSSHILCGGSSHIFVWVLHTFSCGVLHTFSCGVLHTFSCGVLHTFSCGVLHTFLCGFIYFSLWMWKTLLQHTLGVKQVCYDTQVMMRDLLVDFGSLSDCILPRVALVAH